MSDRPHSDPGSSPTDRRPRVLIVKLSALGDLVHAMPVARALKADLQAEIDWITQDEYVDLVACFDDVDRVIGFPRRRFVRHHRRFLRELRTRSYDLIIDLQGLFKSGVVTRLARGTRRIGPSYHRECARLFYSEVPGPADRSRHAVEQAADVIRYLGLKPARRACPMSLPHYNPVGDRPHVAIVPCSRWSTKNWPVERFADVARQVMKRTGGTVYVVGGPDDAEACSRIAEQSSGAVNLCSRTTIAETAGVLRAMDLVISVDTGPMHVAAAAGTPVLAIFGATDPLRTGPHGDRHDVLTTAGLDCRPCMSRRCARGDLACLTRIEVATVVQAAEKMLSARPDAVDTAGQSELRGE